MMRGSNACACVSLQEHPSGAEEEAGGRPDAQQRSFAEPPAAQVVQRQPLGNPKKPVCRGFTPEEFQALDFSRIELSEYYADIEARAHSDIQIDMRDRVDAYLKAVQPQ